MGIVRKFRKLTLHLLATANILVVAALIATGYAGHVSPATHPNFEVLALAFPIPLLMNLAFLLFWLVFLYKYAWIPIVGFLLCASPVRHYCPLNFSKKAPADGIKVMTLNANIFHYHHDTKILPNPTMEYICASDADIICLQESSIFRHRKKLTEQLEHTFRYVAYEHHKHHERLAVLSKYPIVRHEEIAIDSRKNACGAFYLKVGSDTLLVINCHFETSALSGKERDQFGDLVTRRSNSINERSILHKLAFMGRRHAKQANAVMAYIKKHRTKNMSVLVCGDFNDPPVSYAHHVFAKEFTDCHTASSTGPGFTHHAHGMLLRIDHIFCSPDWEPFECEIHSKTAISDHYPVTCTLKKRQNPKNK